MLIIAAAFAVAGMANATDYTVYKLADPAPQKPDSAGFVFTDIVALPTTPVKNQAKSGTCWAFSGVTTLEEDLLRRGKGEFDLSEMFIVRNAYLEKAKKYLRTNGKINFGQGGEYEDVLGMTAKYGAIPEEVYHGINYGETNHSHAEVSAALKAYLDAVMNAGLRSRKLSPAWEEGYNGILDAYFGKVPETFTYKGKTYTPKSFAKEIGLEPEKFVQYTSFTHHPFYEPCALELSDNWQWATSNNVPLADLQRIVDYALDHGYTVFWGADVSEGGFKWANGFAVNPAEKKEDEMTGSELARWVKLSDREKSAALYNIKNGPVPEKTVTQEMRQEGFDNYQTTDDHGMAIVGYAKDQKGNKYYKVKNSWDNKQIYGGFFYVSVPYFLEKTMNIGLREEGVPADIAKKFKK